MQNLIKLFFRGSIVPKGRHSIAPTVMWGHPNFHGLTPVAINLRGYHGSRVLSNRTRTQNVPSVKSVIILT